MSYLSLKKYEYSHHGDSPKEYKRRFECYDSKHIDFNIGSYPAFFVETKEIRDSVCNLYKMDRTVIKLCQELPAEAITHFMVRCLMDEVQISNSIEGVNSTRKEIRDAYEKKSKRFKGIVSKYQLLLSGETIPMISCKDIRTLYDDLVLAEVLEESEKDRPDGKIFRKDHVSVYGNKMESIHEGIYPEEAIIDSMNLALKYLNNDSEELLYRVAVFHYMLGYIHPFYNGNGRLNRFISSYMLSHDLSPLIGFRLSYSVKDEQSSYNKAFDECNDKANFGELTMFVEVFLNILTESMSNLILSLEKRKTAWDKYAGNVSALPFGDKKYYPEVYTALIMYELFATEGAGMNDIMNGANISRPTLQKILESIKETGLLKVDDSGKRFSYGIRLEKIDELLNAASTLKK